MDIRLAGAAVFGHSAGPELRQQRVHDRRPFPLHPQPQFLERDVLPGPEGEEDRRPLRRQTAGHPGLVHQLDIAGSGPIEGVGVEGESFQQ